MSQFEVKKVTLKYMRAHELAELYFHLLQNMDYCGDVATIINDSLLTKFQLTRTELDFDLYTDRVSIRMSPKSSIWIENFGCDTTMSKTMMKVFFNLATTSESLNKEDYYLFVKARYFATMANDHPGNVIIIAENK